MNNSSSPNIQAIPNLNRDAKIEGVEEQIDDGETEQTVHMEPEEGDTGGYSTSEYSQISRTLDSEMRRYVHEF